MAQRNKQNAGEAAIVQVIVHEAFYLRIVELYRKGNGRPAASRALIRNRLAMDDRMQTRIFKYEQY